VQQQISIACENKINAGSPGEINETIGVSKHVEVAAKRRRHTCVFGFVLVREQHQQVDKDDA
jgi:hypothetical protein